MNYRQGRYSSFMKPIFGFVDLCILNIVIFLFEINLTNIYLFSGYLSFLWIIISIKNHFYEVQRHTRIIQIIPLLFRQVVFFSIIVYAFIGFFKQPNISRLGLANYLIAVFVLIAIFKFLFFILLKKYRSTLSGNSRNIIVIGKNEKTSLFNVSNIKQVSLVKKQLV